MSIFFCFLAGQLEVKIKKVSVARSNSAVKAGMSCYPMTSKPRGLALIIEINEYENDVHEPRIGSQVFFLKNGPSLASFSFIFGLFKQTNNTNFTSSQCENKSIQYPALWYELVPFWYEYPTLTTRPGLTTSNLLLFSLQNVNDKIKLVNCSKYGCSKWTVEIILEVCNLAELRHSFRAKIDQYFLPVIFGCFWLEPLSTLSAWLHLELAHKFKSFTNG